MMYMPALFLALAVQRDAPQENRSTPPPKSPFQVDDALKRALGTANNPASNDTFTPLGEHPSLPEMKLKAIVKMSAKAKPAALLEINGIGTYTVREGEKLSFSLAGRFVTAAPADLSAHARESGAASSANTLVRQQIPIVLRIDKVGGDGVVVEVGTLGEFLIIR